MDFLLGFLGAILGIIVIITVLVLIVYSYMKKIIGKSKTKELINLAKNAKMIQNEEYTRVKNVNGMTKLLEPEIIRDFPDFNRELLFSKVESNLIKIFNAIQYKTISNIKDDDELKLLYFKVEDNIKKPKSRSLKENNPEGDQLVKEINENNEKTEEDNSPQLKPVRTTDSEWKK